MSGETRGAVSGWTVDTSREDMLARLDALRLLSDERHGTSKESVRLAEENADKWRANANEWRTAMDNKDRLFITRTEAATQFVGFEGRIKMLEDRSASMAAESRGGGVVWGYIVGCAGGLAAIITLLVTFLRHQ